MLSGFLNNVGAAFNLTVMGLVLVAIADTTKIEARDQSLVGSAGMVGAVSGQLLMGLLGDCLGTVRALFVTTIIILVGSFLSAFLPEGDTLLFTLAICRFVTGFGVGGVYPLTAVASTEQKGNKGPSSMLVVFSGQGWGQLLAPVTVYALASMKFSEAEIWRTTLALAALPCIIALLLIMRDIRRKMQEDQLEAVGAAIMRVAGDHPANVELRMEQERRASLEQIHISEPQTCMKTFFNKKNLKRMLGTGGTWFLFDVTFYSNVVFAPIVLERVLGLDHGSGIRERAGPTCIVLLVALPGYYLAIALAQRFGLKRLQIFGFVMLALLYGILAASTNVLPPGALFTLYALTFFFSNLGPNSTTFCLPARTFPKASRSTFNGISAAMGKAGAVVGTAMFPPILQAGGIAAALGVSSFIALLGALLTWLFVESEFIPQGQRSRRVGDAGFVGMVEMSAPLSVQTTSLEQDPSYKRMPFSSSHGAIPLMDNGANPFGMALNSYERISPTGDANGALERT
jgi:PHS family inorganic phosphate transporter-like MFS transporter